MALRTLEAQRRPLHSGSAGDLSTLGPAHRPLLQVRASRRLHLSVTLPPAIHPSLHPRIPRVIRADHALGSVLGVRR